MHIRPSVPSAVPSVPFLARCLLASSSSTSSSSSAASSLGHPSPRSAALPWRGRGRGNANANANASSARNAAEGGVVRPFSTTARPSKPFTAVKWRAKAKQENTQQTIPNPQLGERVYLFANEKINSVAYSHDSTFDVRSVIEGRYFVGKKETLVKFRRNEWSVMALVEFPPGHAVVGRSVLQKLYELQRRHYLEWGNDPDEPPKTSNALMQHRPAEEEKKYGYDDDGKAGAWDLEEEQRNDTRIHSMMNATRSERGQMLQNQRGSAIADLAVILAGAGKGNLMWHVRRNLAPDAPPTAHDARSVPGSIPAVYSMRAAVQRHLVAIEREDQEGRGPEDRAAEREQMLQELEKMRDDPAGGSDDALQSKEISRWRRLVRKRQNKTAQAEKELASTPGNGKILARLRADQAKLARAETKLAKHVGMERERLTTLSDNVSTMRAALLETRVAEAEERERVRERLERARREEGFAPSAAALVESPTRETRPHSLAGWEERRKAVSRGMALAAEAMDRCLHAVRVYWAGDRDPMRARRWSSNVEHVLGLPRPEVLRLAQVQRTTAVEVMANLKAEGEARREEARKRQEEREQQKATQVTNLEAKHKRIDEGRAARAPRDAEAMAVLPSGDRQGGRGGSTQPPAQW